MTYQICSPKYLPTANIAEVKLNGLGLGNHVACAFDYHVSALDAFAFSPLIEGVLVPNSYTHTIDVDTPAYNRKDASYTIEHVINPRVESHILRIKALFGSGATKVWVFREGHTPVLGPKEVHDSKPWSAGVKEAIDIAFLNAVCNDDFLLGKIRQGKLIIAWMTAVDVRKTLDLPTDKVYAKEVAVSRFNRLFDEVDTRNNHIVDAVLLKLAGIAIINSAYSHDYALPETPGHEGYMMSQNDADGIINHWNKNLIVASEYLSEIPLETPYIRIPENNKQKPIGITPGNAIKDSIVVGGYNNWFINVWVPINKVKLPDGEFRRILRKFVRKDMKRFGERLCR